MRLMSGGKLNIVEVELHSKSIEIKADCGGQTLS